MLRYLLLWIAAGVLIPVLLLTFHYRIGIQIPDETWLFFWPSSIMTMALERPFDLWVTIKVLGFSIFINAVLYLVIGLVLKVIFKVIGSQMYKHESSDV